MTLRGRSLVSAAVLVTLVAVPAVALIQDDRPARWGWQMYSGSNPAPEITVEMPDGPSEPVTFSDVAAGYRPEVDYVEPIARFVCEHEPDATSVTITTDSGRTTTSC